MAATGKTLQEGATLSHGTAALVRLRSRVRGETLLICFIGLPIDEAWMMLGDENLPLGTRQESNPLLARASAIENRLVASFAIDIGAGIDGIGQDLVDGGVACLDRADLGAGVQLQREREPLGLKPEPNATHRSHLGKARKNIPNGGNDSLIGIEADLAISLAPDEADRQTAAQFAARRLVVTLRSGRTAIIDRL